jgi:hypothetical protein
MNLHTSGGATPAANGTAARSGPSQRSWMTLVILATAAVTALLVMTITGQSSANVAHAGSEVESTGDDEGEHQEGLTALEAELVGELVEMASAANGSSYDEELLAALVELAGSEDAA